MSTRTLVAVPLREVGDRTLRDQPAVVHHPDVAAHLLRPRPTGDWRPARWPRRRPGRRSGAEPRGCPAGRARWSARRGRADPEASTTHSRSPAAAACPRSTPGTVCRPRPASPPGRARRRSGAGRCADRRSGQRHPAGPDWRVRRGRGGRPAPRPAPRPDAERPGISDGDPGAEQRDLTGRRRDEPQQHPDGGGLAGAVGTEEAVDRAVRHGQGDIVHRELGAESLAQTAGDHRGFRARRRWPTASCHAGR